MRRRLAAAVLLVVAGIGGGARAGDEPLRADPRAASRWEPGETVTASVVEATDSEITVTLRGTTQPTRSVATRVEARFVRTCVEIDAEGRPARSLVRVDAWRSDLGGVEDRCLEGAVLETSPAGWTLLRVTGTPSRAARGWLDNRFGPAGRGFSGGLAELGAPGPVAAGDAWSAQPPAIAAGFAKGMVPTAIDDRPWTFRAEEVAAAGAGASAKVTFDETFAPSGAAASEGRAVKVLEGSTVRVWGTVEGVPGRWHRTGRVETSAEVDLRTTTGGADVYITTTSEERETWDAGGEPAVRPVRAADAPPAVALRGDDPWVAGDVRVETGRESVDVMTTPVHDDEREGPPERDLWTVAWSAEVACDEVDSSGDPAALVVSFREWTMSGAGEDDASLAGAVVRVTAKGWRLVDGPAATVRAEDWLTERFGGGCPRDDAVRAVFTPFLPVEPGATWTSDPLQTAAAVQTRVRMPIDRTAVRGSARLVRAEGAGDAATAAFEYEITSGISCVPGCSGTYAHLVKGDVHVVGTAEGPPERWTWLGSQRERMEVVGTQPPGGPEEEYRRMHVVEERDVVRKPIAPERAVARRAVREGRALVKAGDHAGAVAAYDRAIAADPAYAEAWYRRAASRKALGDPAGALADYDAAIERDPRHGSAHNDRGLLRRAGGDADGALADFARAAGLSASSPLPPTNRGDTLCDRGDWAEAVEAYGEALRRRANHVSALCGRARARIVLGESDDAIDDCDRAVRADPKSARAWYLRALAHEGKRAAWDGISDATRCLEIDARHVGALEVRGRLRQREDDHDGAIADFDAALAVNAGSAGALANRAASRLAKDDPAGAVADATRALATDGAERARALDVRARALDAAGDLAAALADWDAALAADPDDAGPRFAAARARFRPGLPAQDAADALRAAVAADPEREYARLWLCLARRRAGDGDAAAKDLTAFAAAWKGEDAAWFPVLARFVAGEIDEDALFAAAKADDARTSRERRCEAAYYAGVVRALRGDVAGAIGQFDACRATRVTAFTEFEDARRWRVALAFGATFRPADGGAALDVCEADGPAARAGLRAGDVVTALDGAACTPAALVRAFRDAAPGTVVRLGVRRGAETTTADVAAAGARR